MAEKSVTPALQDIVDSIDRINKKVDNLSFEEFRADIDRRQIIERNIEIISEASRRLPEDLKSRHPDIPWQKVASIGNILRHEYDSVSPLVLWNVARQELGPLGKACKIELIRGKFDEKGEHSHDHGERSR
ncbi:MAG TPA: HepT-like ribonuclease domain-containing protein [Methylovirgula sp.]